MHSYVYKFNFQTLQVDKHNMHFTVQVYKHHLHTLQVYKDKLRTLQVNKLHTLQV
jgi:hypothetical protein